MGERLASNVRQVPVLEKPRVKVHICPVETLRRRHQMTTLSQSAPQKTLIHHMEKDTIAGERQKISPILIGIGNSAHGLAIKTNFHTAPMIPFPGSQTAKTVHDLLREHRYNE